MSTKNSDDIEEFATTESIDCCSVLPETLFVGNSLCVDTTRVLSVGIPFPHEEHPETGQSLASNRL